MSVATYIAAYSAWLRNGKPGTSPSSPAHDVSICDCMREIEQAEQYWLSDSGIPPDWSCWRIYDPAYMKPMKEARRQAAAAGEDPDAAARAFTAAFIAAQGGKHGQRVSE
jgi:hypothetical protein